MVSSLMLFSLSRTVLLVTSVVQEQDDLTDIESRGNDSDLVTTFLSSVLLFLTGSGGPTGLEVALGGCSIPAKLTMLVKPLGPKLSLESLDFGLESL